MCQLIRLIALSATFTSVVATVCAQDASEDLKRLQGTWEVVSAHWHGKDATKDMPAGYKITFRKDRTIVEFKGSEGGVGDDSRVKLNPSKSPKEFEWSFTLNLSTGSRDVHARLELPGIYEIEGDTLKLCWDVGRATGRRPTGFKTEKGTEHLALVLKRAKSGK